MPPASSFGFIFVLYKCMFRLSRFSVTLSTQVSGPKLINPPINGDTLPKHSSQSSSGCPSFVQTQREMKEKIQMDTKYEYT